MARELDCKLKDGTTVMNSVMVPLRDKSIELKVVDVGARNGMQEDVIPRSYSKESTIIGFDPNPDEYNKEGLKELAINSYSHAECNVKQGQGGIPFINTE